MAENRNLVLRATRSVDSSIASLGPFEKWGWVKIHGASLLSYMEMGSGGLQKFREELEAENEGVRLPSEARWLGGAVTRARFKERKLLRSSVVLAVVGEAAEARLCRQGIRLAGLRHEVEPFGEARQMAKGWRSPSQPPRGRRASAHPEDETPEGPVTEAGSEMEVEMQSGAAAKTAEYGGAGGLDRVLFVFLCLFPLSCFTFSGEMGRRRSGCPARIEQVDLGRDTIICKSHHVVQAPAPPLPWPLGPHVAGYQIQDDKK